MYSVISLGSRYSWALLIFLIYVDDEFKLKLEVSINSFADDAVLVYNSRSRDQLIEK